ncbi:MAG TPA: hypothetical protein VLN49_13420 [Gemmatimonadaceae bacterium]|nr:hypothetical protein [Gemmatimonadaceae bacterium]
MIWRWHALLTTAIGLIVPCTAVAQRIQVAAGDTVGKTVSVIEFRLCIPAETSDCGAWVDRVVDMTGDDAAAMPPAIRALHAPNGRDSLWIEDGAVRIRANAPARARTFVVRDVQGIAVALAASGDQRYAFALVEPPAGRVGGSTIVMIDLERHGVVDSFGSRTRFTGIAMVR